MKKKRKLNFDENEKKWKRATLPEVDYSLIFAHKTSSPRDFILCALFGFHRCLPEILWEPFKKVVQQNKDLYRQAVVATQNLTLSYTLEDYEIEKAEKIEDGEKFGDNIVKYTPGTDGWSDDVLRNLFEAPRPSPFLVEILNVANSYSARHWISVRINELTWKLFGYSRKDVELNPCTYTPFVDVSLDLPTGQLTLFRMLYRGTQCEHYCCEFFFDHKNEKILTTVKDMEFARLAKDESLREFLNGNLCRVIIEYSMCPYQTLCRYVEWEARLYADMLRASD